MGKYKSLLNNSIVFAVGNLGTKVITMLLVPLYTYTLSTAEYGTADLITSIVNLSLPLVSLSIFEAVLRFVMDKSEESSKVLYNGLLVTALSSFFLIIPIGLVFIFSSEHLPTVLYLSVILFLQMFQSLFSQYLRGIGKVKVFAINGITSAVCLAIANIVLLIRFNLKIDGYFLSIIIANIVSNIFLLWHVKLKTIINDNKIDITYIKNMLVYSIPLIPNSLMWWIVNTSSRYFILYFSGVEANGLFAVSAKIPSIITIFQSIFFQAWQLSAIDEFNNKDRDDFYQKIFDAFSSFMFILTALVILFIKPIIKIAVSDTFYSSWEFVPFLLVGVIFSSLSSFMGTLYVASKDTNEIMRSSFFGALTNIIICLILIPFIGAHGASIASMISFILIFLYRSSDIYRKINFRINLSRIIWCTSLLVLEIILLLFGDMFTILPVILLVVINRDNLISLFKVLRK